MLENLLTAFPACWQGEWRPGQAFVDAQEETAGLAGTDRLVAELGQRPLELLLHGPRAHRLELRAAMVEPCIIAGDVLAARTRDGELVVTFAAPHTVVGTIGAAGSANLADLDGTPCPQRGQLAACDDGEGVLVLASFGPLFALARGRDRDEARTRALAGVASMPWQQAESRLARSCGAALAERREI